MITLEELKTLLDYDLGIGVFRWKILSRAQTPIGTIAGYTNNNGYTVIKINGRGYMAHRLAWFYVYGKMPIHDIDHINGVKTDNRLINLREATRAENLQNLRKANSNNKSGYLGVRFHKTYGKFQAEITVNGKQKYLGRFPTAELAHAAYVKAKRKLHPFGGL